ncbi:HlyU family transcriptional regulator [Motiliproteus sp. MSK22-1]|uniref:HlyU family transcriptional regulator n=1 Tax=Motiliproteus sp. MSK22-1 TaxID=1897630 RepID=UPI000975C236|nr:HlyU family transcriptional regulator [Motiliproteus sp. MSK22-1]OMH32627.1 hypothetical protein BGP75_13835 [Motiliproteus sp. MSK22-1]
MTVLSTLISLFTPLPEGTIRYKGFTIAATPEADGNRYRISGNIKKKSLQRNFTLVDRVDVRDECVQLVHHKAKVFIDQKGDELFT